MKTLDEHLAEFKRVGFTLFPGMLDAAWVARDARRVRRHRRSHPDG